MQEHFHWDSVQLQVAAYTYCTDGDWQNLEDLRNVKVYDSDRLNSAVQLAAGMLMRSGLEYLVLDSSRQEPVELDKLMLAYELKVVVVDLDIHLEKEKNYSNTK